MIEGRLRALGRRVLIHPASDAYRCAEDSNGAHEEQSLVIAAEGHPASVAAFAAPPSSRHCARSLSVSCSDCRLSGLLTPCPVFPDIKFLGLSDCEPARRTVAYLQPEARPDRLRFTRLTHF
jgi:hypothetical protein